jgi:aspartyl aminopeptidase
LKEDRFNIEKHHWETFTDVISKDINVARENIVNFELSLCDAHPAGLTGLHQEFVSSPRLDNLASSLCAMDALIDHKRLPLQKKNNAEVDMIMLFDHEEVGSQSAQGADSNMAQEVTERIWLASQGESSKEGYYRAIHRSLMISADMAHAVHPNYSDRHHN